MRHYWLAWITELSGAVASSCNTTDCTPPSFSPRLSPSCHIQVMSALSRAPVDERTYDTLDTA